MDEDDVGGVLSVDLLPEQVEAMEGVYPDYRLEDTVVISGPLLHGVALSDEDEARRMGRREARAWARKRYGKYIETIWHPHRWCIRIFRSQLPGVVDG